MQNTNLKFKSPITPVTHSNQSIDWAAALPVTPSPQIFKDFLVFGSFFLCVLVWFWGFLWFCCCRVCCIFCFSWLFSSFLFSPLGVRSAVGAVSWSSLNPTQLRFLFLLHARTTPDSVS